MKKPVWVRRDVVLAFHDRLLAEHGGSAGLRDGGLLDSALGRQGKASVRQVSVLTIDTSVDIL